MRYDELSPVLALQGNGFNFQNARHELEMALSCIKSSELKMTLTECLLISVREKFRLDNQLLCVFTCDARPSTVLLYSLSDATMQTATALLQQGLVIENIDNVPSVVYNEIITDFQHSRFVQIKGIKNSVSIQSYLQQECVCTARLLRQRLDASYSQQSKVEGSPEEIAYLIHLHKIDHMARERLSSLPVDFIIKKNSAFLKGNAQAVLTAHAQIRKEFLSQVFTRRFVYQNKKFVSQLEDFVLKPVRNEVLLIMQEHKKPSKQRVSAEENDISIDVIVCSKNLEVFQSVCSKLENAKSSYRKLTLQRGAALSIRLDEIKPELEMKYRVRIFCREYAATIHGITEQEVYDCAAEIQLKIESCHAISKYIPLTYYQRLFFTAKCKQVLEELKEGCNYLRIIRDPEKNGILIKGPIKIVEMVHAKLTKRIDHLSEIKVEVQYERKFYHMWKKRWDQIKTDKESCCDVLVYILTEAKQSSASRNEVTFTTIYIVGDQSQVDQIGVLISQTAVISKCIPLTATAANTLKKDKKEFLWPLVVYFYINSRSGTFEAELTAPEDYEEDLDSAEDEIHKFLGECTLTNKNLTSRNEIVGLVLNSRSNYPKYLSLANSIARNCGVKIYPLRKPQSGLRLIGTAAAIQSAEQPLITQVLDLIESNISIEQLKVKSMFRSVFPASSFLQFVSKLRDDMCVVCTFPWSNKTNKVVRSAMIQPSRTARCVKLELCHGSIVEEQTDAIVNAANEDLKHIGGLAKAIFDAGGQTIQTESDFYVKDYGKLKAGEAVALGPGKLTCRAIIHAVGPRWMGGNLGEETLLYDTVQKCLVLANTAQYESVSLPAISVGMFGVPTNICARASLKAVQDFCQSYPDATLHTVRFILFAEQQVDAFCSSFDSGVVIMSNSSSSPLAGAIASSTTVPSPSATWLWTNDLGTFTPFTSDVSQLLSTAYAKNSEGSCKFSHFGVTYCVDFPTRTQTNVQTGHRRIVKHDASTSPLSSRGNACWYYMDDKQGFSPYTPSQSLNIERMFQNGVPGFLTIGSSTYTFDFSTMSQISTKTNYKRRLQRNEVTAQSSPLPKKLPSDPPQHEVWITLHGPRDSVDAAKIKLLKKLESYKMKDTITVRFALSSQFSSKLQDIAVKDCVAYSVTENKTGSKTESVILLEGIDSNVQRVVKTVQQLIIDHQLDPIRAEMDVATPPEWQDQDRNTQVFPVPQGSPEWSKVEQRFTATLARRIVSVSRIQNRWLWEAYCMHKRRLHIKNDGNVNEKELFHGTRNNNPKDIYEGENGFDMRYSNQGMWGTANYFAVNASYSNSYSFKSSDGCREMFLVRVLTGDSYRCDSNSRLRKPPEKPRGSNSGKVDFSKVDYDCVTGETGGSQVYMTYDNDKAYPAYLIKYE